MRPVKDWDITDIQSYIDNQVQESLNLDYKQSDSLENSEKCKNEISKDVSAFANSDGGVIVYGVVEEGHLPKTIDKGIDSAGKREWLEQVIGSTIEPRIQDVLIKQIDLDQSSRKAIFVVQVPVGMTAHQASDRKYYRRFNYQSVAMHDYEVKMVMDRVREPFLDITMSLDHIIDDQFSLNVSARNSGLISAPSAYFRLIIPKMIAANREVSLWRYEDDATYDSSKVVISLNWGSGDTEFFPGLSQTLASKSGPTLRLRLETSMSHPIFYEIYATNMKPRKGKFLIKMGLAGRYEISKEPSIQK